MSDNNGLEPKAPVARTESVGSLDFHPSSKEEHKKSKASLNIQNMEDSGEVKFSKDSVEGKGDAAVEIEAVPHPFAGMGKDELMKYANDPFWVRLRWFLFILFWLGWLGMLGAAIAIIIGAPKCPAPTPVEYWQESPVYQVLPRAFESSGSDPSGLKAITSRIDHFSDLGIEVVLLSSIFKSKYQTHEGYDTVDFKAIDDRLGSMEDFKTLIKAADAKGLKIVLDMVPNHSSDEHEWFKESIKGNKTYSDYYVWRNCTADNLPNNWLSVTGGSAWTYNDERKQCYLHQFGKERPDFNLNNDAVRQELLNDTLQFWMNHGVAGFRLGAVHHLYEDDEYKDEPGTGTDYESMNHTYTVNQPKNMEALTTIRNLLNNNKISDTTPRILLTDTDEPIADLIKFYGEEEGKLADIPLNHQLIKELKEDFDAKTLLNVVGNVIKTVPSWAWPNWVLSNSKKSRSATRLAPNINSLALVQMTLPGTPVIYYGEEIGMEDDGSVDDGQTLSYDPACGVMNWTAVGEQKTSNSSRYTVYKSLVALRKKTAILYGTTEFLDEGRDIFAFTRIRRGSPGYLVITNFGSETRSVNLEGKARLPEEMTVEIRTAESVGTAPKDKVSTANVTLAGHEGLVLSFVPKEE